MSEILSAAQLRTAREGRMAWILSDCLYPENMEFENDPNVAIQSAEQLSELLLKYVNADTKPRILILDEEDFGTLQIGVSRKWCGLAYFGTRTSCYLIPKVAQQGESTDYRYFGQPCRLSADEVFDVAQLIDIVLYIYNNRQFPPNVKIRPM